MFAPHFSSSAISAVTKKSRPEFESYIFFLKWFGHSSKENGIEGTFGWLQAPATKLFNRLA
jgi:hypothetical protein